MGRELNFALVPLYVLILFLLTVRSGYAFFDDFSSLNSDTWHVDSNGGVVDIQSDGGDGYMFLKSGWSTRFPYVHSKYDLFPVSGDYEFEIKFRFLGLDTVVWGNGITIGDIYPENGISGDSYLDLFSTYFFYQLWADTGGGWRVGAWDCPLADPSVCVNLHEVYPNTGAILRDGDWHILKLKYVDGKYLTYIDGELKSTSALSQRRFHYMWIGEPALNNSPLIRPEINIDYIKINPLGLPYMNQADTRWRSENYDSAEKWYPLDPSIGRWGCALTSAAMVLNYYSHIVDPKSLNNWLSGEQDGYMRNGLVNWLAVSRFTKINSDENARALEYKRFHPNNQILDAELENQKPVVLGLPGHFVVAKSKTGDNYQIHDPAFADRTNLSFYDNNYLSISTFTPSQTDLSYLMFVVDDDVSIQLLNETGEPIGELFEEFPIVDDIDGIIPSGERLVTLMYAQPPNGLYKVKVNGPYEDYQLDAYLYDDNGNFTGKKFEGVNGQGYDTFAIQVDEEQGIYDINRVISLVELKENWENFYRARLIKFPLYRLVVAQLNNAQKFSDRNNIIKVKNSLRLIQGVIKSLTPIFIDEHTGEVILEQIRALSVSM